MDDGPSSFPTVKPKLRRKIGVAEESRNATKGNSRQGGTGVTKLQLGAERGHEEGGEEVGEEARIC